jgi:hypothetical protein
MFWFFKITCKFFRFVSGGAHTIKVWAKVFTTFEETSGFVLVLDLFIHILRFLFSVIGTQMRVWYGGGGVGSWDLHKLMNPMFNATTIHWIWIEHS